MFSFISVGRDYCRFETFNATCGHDAVVVMDTARYGRMEFGRCVDRDYGYVGCSAGEWHPGILPYVCDIENPLCRHLLTRLNCNPMMNK